MKSMKGIKICLLVEHLNTDMSHSIYMIEPPADLGEYEKKEIDSNGFVVDTISPFIELNDIGGFITRCAMFKLDSRIYFIGGDNIAEINYFAEARKIGDIHFDRKVKVRVLDIDNLELGLYSVASLNAPKQTPCVFSAGGLIYALGSPLLPGATGCFERYDPDADKWQILPDPPLQYEQMGSVIWRDCATVVKDRYVFLWNLPRSVYLIFDLLTQKWVVPLSNFTRRFPYGSLYVDGSLYYLKGRGSLKRGNQVDRKEGWHFSNELNLFKRGPLLDDIEEDPTRLLKSRCLRPEDAQVMATVRELDDGPYFTGYNPAHWREIFHLGDRFFCYVVTSQLVNCNDYTLNQPYCRGVWIKVFEEVPSSNSSTGKAHFRTLASFCYKIHSPFIDDGFFVRCCAFGSVPDSWVKAPLKTKQVVTKERKTLKAENGGGSKGQRDGNLENVVAAQEKKIIMLKAELAKKDELLRDYEAFLAKSECKLAAH